MMDRRYNGNSGGLLLVVVKVSGYQWLMFSVDKLLMVVELINGRSWLQLYRDLTVTVLK